MHRLGFYCIGCYNHAEDVVEFLNLVPSPNFPQPRYVAYTKAMKGRIWTRPCLSPATQRSCAVYPGKETAQPLIKLLISITLHYQYY